ncbi:hypothetical protein PHLGIDRAFT_128005 [Phlebiopsis gigantea 11061_1 CR5-6]|uniref:Uncharacterized protein n=1 Tax=Phlebiopsis gigantea (strain 11061_1 CR5-6) TaxID=745531 RepID=A0A0C3S7P4_PHLG1|nr:hypothetical protein PHLGIDRAFT_128005 [Phlebiopsis gigantea 11061_1 CR5-6]
MVDTSSFFWLGLVGAVFIGLVLAITRARLARDPHVSLPLRAQQPKPQLWDVFVPVEDWKGKRTEGTESTEWKEILPLSLCSFVDAVLTNPPSTPPPKHKRFPFFGKQPQDIESQIIPSPKIDAQVTTVVLMPTPRKHTKTASGSRDSSVTISDDLPQEFAIGIASVHGPTRDDLGALDMTS